MKFTGKIKGLYADVVKKTYELTLTVNEKSALAEFEKIQDCDKLTIEVKKYRKARSDDANRLFWACVGDIAEALEADKWEIYLKLLKRYGVYTYIVVRPEAVKATQEQWRESEVIGNIDLGGQKGVQMLVYFGSHTYDTEQFSRLLDGTFSEMREIGLYPPTSGEVQRSLEAWEKRYGRS